MADNTIRTLKHLDTSKRIWFVCLLISQWVFATYLALGYGVSAVTYSLEGWNTFNNSAYVAGDTLGNTAYGIHVLLAIIMMLGGSLQLIPSIRQRTPRFHRINGRVFVSLACLISIAGMYLMTSRGTVGNLLMQSLTAFSGVVVLVSSFFAVSAARNKRFLEHQVWAVRLYLAANGVLFFRLLIFAWFMVFGDLGVNTEDFTGPTVVAVSFSSYLFPLIIYELVRHAGKSNKAVGRIFTSALLVVIGLIFLLGLVSISLANWYPAVMAV